MLKLKEEFRLIGCLLNSNKSMTNNEYVAYYSIISCDYIRHILTVMHLLQTRDYFLILEYIKKNSNPITFEFSVHLMKFIIQSRFEAA